MALLEDYVTSISCGGLFWIIVVTCVTWLVYRVYIAPKLSPLSKIPGYRGNWLMGILSAGVSERKDAGLVILEQVHKLGREVFRVHGLLGRPALAIAGPEWYKYVTITKNSNTKKPHALYGSIEELLGPNGLITVEGEGHRNQRRLCSQAFNSNMLKSLFVRVERNSMNLIRYWKQLINRDNCVKKTRRDDLVKIDNDLHRATLDMIVGTSFDYTSSILWNPDGEINKAIRECMSSFAVTPARFIPFFKYLPIPKNWSFGKSKRILSELICDMISKKQNRTDIIDGSAPANNLLTMMIHARDNDNKSMTYMELHDQVMTFLFSGTGSPSSTLSWCLYSLACHQDIQEKVRKEVTSIVPDINTPLTIDLIDQMTYLLCTLKETLRLHTPVPVIARELVNDDVIDGWDIPAGTHILLYNSAIHLSPKYWKEPDKFRPERFLREADIQPFTFLPFSAGPRMCIGYKFGLMEMKIYIAQLLRQFKFELTPGMEDVGCLPGLSSTPEPPIVLKLTLL